MTGGKPIAVLLQSILGVSAIDFNDFHGGKIEVLLFCPGHHTRHVNIFTKKIYKY
jgi:hypothetical protein